MSDDLGAEAARLAEDASTTMRAVAEVSDRRHVDYDPPQPLDGLDTESLASFNLKRIRTALGVSQQQIADRLAEQRAIGQHDVKLSQTQIAKIERGERPWRLNELVAISVALGVEMNEFFSGQPASNDANMLVLTAKLKYQRAQANEEDAREDLRAAIRATFEAENELLKVAAQHEIADREVLHILTQRALRDHWVEIAEREPGPTEETLKERKDRARRYVAQEWHRLVEQETGHPPTRKFEPQE